MLLKAVFGKEYSSEATKRINEWVDTLTGNPITADKTAHVHDYDNRIYEIDFSASSGRYTVEPDITLEFLTDASRQCISLPPYYRKMKMIIGLWVIMDRSGMVIL